MKLPRFFTQILVAAATFLPVVAQTIGDEKVCRKVDSWSVLYNFERTEKGSAHSNDQIDVDTLVLENVFDQLRTKVGSDFINFVHFSHVRGVDFDSKAELSLGDLKRIDAYDFTFEVRMGEDGVFRYAFAIGTDKNGNFLEDIAVPNVARSTDKGTIKSCTDAVRAVRHRKVLTETKNIFVRLRFDRVHDVFVWDVSTYREGPGLHSDHLWLDARTLAVIKKFDQYEAF